MDTPNPAWLKMLAQATTIEVMFPSALTITTIIMSKSKSKIWHLFVNKINIMKDSKAF